MALPQPSSSFTLPSLNDDLELDCRLYYSRRSEKNIDLFGRSYAILAHPYAPLGGCYDDPVVALVGGTLLRRGVTLITFNFRGAHGSAGRTSWSGKPELGDFVSIYGFALCYLSYIEESKTPRDTQDSATSTKPILVLGGYSYGSYIASHLPSQYLVSKLFRSTSKGSTEHEIKLRAEHMARDMIAYLDTQAGSFVERGRSNLRATDATSGSPRGVAIGGYESEDVSRRISRESSRKSLDTDRVRHSIERARQKLTSTSGNIQDMGTSASISETNQVQIVAPNLAYLLVSPILPPISWLTTMFSNLKFDPRKSHSDTNSSQSAETQANQLLEYPSCCVFGSKDVFTSEKKLRKWAEDLKAKSKSMFSSYEVNGAGHFWHEPGVSNDLQSAVAGWLSQLR